MRMLSRTALVLALSVAGFSPGVASACCPSGGVGTPKPGSPPPQPSSPTVSKQADAAGVSVVRIGDLELIIHRDFTISTRRIRQG